MKENVKFLRCAKCGNMATYIKDGGVPIVCCGEPMKILKANTEDAAVEKHVPYCEVKDGKLEVQIGEDIHPMLDEHWIEWIAVVSEAGIEITKLKPGMEPKATFCNYENVDVYEYCNLHGLWKKSL
ncbi:MAG: desulfoferrodoxin [Clostridiales bacterium]|nr:desulfoferrodoxin [Clostridiales bacterium]